MRPTARSTPAFTIVELLVVVSILTLLIALLLPALGKSRDMARRAICQGTLRQYKIGNDVYADDNNDLYLPIRSGDGTYWMWNKEYRVLVGADPNTYDFPHMRCASIEPDAVGSGGLLHNSYGWNRTPQGWYDTGIFIKRLQVHRPSAVVQNIDGTDWHIDVSYGNYVVNWDIYRQTRLWSVAYRHEEGANVQFFDGHVLWMAKEEVYPSDSNARADLWDAFR